MIGVRWHVHRGQSPAGSESTSQIGRLTLVIYSLELIALEGQAEGGGDALQTVGAEFARAGEVAGDVLLGYPGEGGELLLGHAAGLHGADDRLAEFC